MMTKLFFSSLIRVRGFMSAQRLDDAARPRNEAQAQRFLAEKSTSASSRNSFGAENDATAIWKRTLETAAVYVTSAPVTMCAAAF